MSLTIWKHPVVMDDFFSRLLPKGARVLSVDVQRGETQMWFLCDPNAPKETRHFRLFGTGFEIEEKPEELSFVGTFQLHGGALVFHLFEITGERP